MALFAFPELVESFISSIMACHYSEAMGCFSMSFPPQKKRSSIRFSLLIQLSELGGKDC